MKKFFYLVCALFVSTTMFAQTIAIDGANTDWANVPMLTEPGVSPIVKMVVPQAGLTLPKDAAFCVMTEGEAEKMLADYPALYVDADKSNTTGTKEWYSTIFGYDYEFTKWTTGVQVGASTSGDIREMCYPKTAFDAISFTGSLWVFVGFDWGNYMIPATPTMDGWKWSETQYHPFEVKSYTYADLAGTHTAAGAYSTHRALLPGATLQLSQGEHDTEFWVSWTVELKKAAKYYVTLDATASNTASADMWLVDPATNKVVATFTGEDIQAPAGKTAYGAWDLSKVPAGKYMLKLKNHVQWSDIALKSVAFSTSAPSAVENTMVTPTAQKVIENGQVYIIRGNERISVLGTTIR